MNGEFSFAVAESKPTLRGDEFWHVGISGGKDSSAALLYMLHESGIPKERILATWCDIGNDHEYTREHVKWISENLHPVETIKPEKDFFELVEERGMFPSPCARWCTEELKIIPTACHIQRLKYEGKRIVAVSGVRAGESDERSKLLEWDFSGNLFCWQWRPLLGWATKDVFEYHKKHNVPLNPLYASGALRVGCWPCIMSRKSEIRNIALNFPERIAEIENYEKKNAQRTGRHSGFFSLDKVPKRFRTVPIVTNSGEKMMAASIRDVVKWSLTGKRARGSFEVGEHGPVSCNSGFCE